MIRKYISTVLSLSVLLCICACARKNAVKTETAARTAEQEPVTETAAETAEQEPVTETIAKETKRPKALIEMFSGETESETEPETEEKKDGWEKRYKAVLKKYEEEPKHDCWYNYYIYDIEEDGIPELLIYEGKIAPVSDLYIYSYDPETDMEHHLGESRWQSINLCGLCGENGIINQDGKVEYETDFIIKISDGKPETDVIFNGYVGEFHKFEALRNFELSDTSGIDTWECNPEDNNRKVIDEFLSEHIIPDSSFRELTDADIKGMDQNTLWLAIDEITARHGTIFQNEEKNNYFSGKSWYMPFRTIQEFCDKDQFSELEWNNIRLMTETIMKNCDLSVIPSSKEFTDSLPEENGYLVSTSQPIEHEGYYEVPHCKIGQYVPDEWGVTMTAKVIARDVTVFIRKDARFSGVLAKQLFDELGGFFFNYIDDEYITLNTLVPIFDKNGYLIKGTAFPYG